MKKSQRLRLFLYVCVFLPSLDIFLCVSFKHLVTEVWITHKWKLYFYKGKTKNQHYLIHQLIMSYTFIFLLTAFLFRENDVNTNWMKFGENEQCSELRFQLAYTWINIFNAKLNVNFVGIVIHGKTGKCQYKKKYM